MNAIIPQTERLQLEACKCGTHKLPELKRFTGRSLAMWFFCRACGFKAVQAYAPDRAAIKWNEAQASS